MPNKNKTGLFGAKTPTANNGVRKVAINAMSAIGTAALVAFTIGLAQLDIGNLSEAQKESLPMQLVLGVVVGLVFLVGAARIAADLEKE